MSNNPQVRKRVRKGTPPPANCAGHDPHRPVGYGNPPRAGQFRKGQSGNPKGRPRLKKNLATLVDEVLYQPVEITEGGRRRKVPALEALVKRLRNEALNGDHKALDRLMKLYQARASMAPENAETEAASETPAERAMMEELAGWVSDAGALEEPEPGDDVDGEVDDD